MKLEKELAEYRAYLRNEERSVATVEKYLRDVRAFCVWLAGQKLEKEAVVSYKAGLVERYASASVNSMLAGINGFLAFIGHPECRVKTLKTQRRIYCDKGRELSKPEYLRLVAAAKQGGNRRLMLLMQAICSTGIRVSELCFITCEAVGRGRAEVRCKGKTRTVLLPCELCRVLGGYMREQRITCGPIFVTRSGSPLDRSNIWSDMKRLCAAAKVTPSKVFPHNLRHLFARTFYALEKDLDRLADLLGHSSINTTRIYMVSSGAEHKRKLDRLGLVS